MLWILKSDSALKQIYNFWLKTVSSRSILSFRPSQKQSVSTAPSSHLYLYMQPRGASIPKLTVKLLFNKPVRVLFLLVFLSMSLEENNRMLLVVLTVTNIFLILT